MISPVHGPPLTGTFDGRNHHFTWHERGLQVQLPTRTSIQSLTIQECGITSRFTFPPSARPISKVYELSCICKENGEYATTGAEVTLPFLSEGRYGLSFVQASRVPTYWQCDLSPVYCFHTARGGQFRSSQSRAKIEVEEFDCLICVCSQT